MTLERKYFVDVFGHIIEDVRLKYDLKNNLTPYYMYGHPLEILKILTERDSSKDWKYRKYPLIALYQDFKETKGTTDYEMIVSPRVIIVDQTKQDFYTEDRYNVEFKPILYPIYEQLLLSMAESCMIDVTDPDQIVHDKTDRVSWGSETIQGPDGLEFNDYLDAIDITFKDIKIFKTQSCIPIIKASNYVE